MGRIYGYIRTSRRQTQGQSGSAPEAQVLQLRDAGVPPDLIYRDVGGSGATGTNSRRGWRARTPVCALETFWWSPRWIA